MSQAQSDISQTRFVPAPPPTSPDIPASIFGVKLHENEDVEWCWLELPDGNKVVTNCRIINRNVSEIAQDNGAF